VVGHCFGKVYINKIKEIAWWNMVATGNFFMIYFLILLATELRCTGKKTQEKKRVKCVFLRASRIKKQ
jgi:hypothetical protein